MVQKEKYSRVKLIHGPSAASVMTNLVMCAKCGKWVHGRCTKMKIVTSTKAKGLIREVFVKTKKGIVEPGKE